MMLKLIPKPMKEWLKTKIANAAHQGQVSVTVAAVGYIPYKGGDDFVIPKSTLHNHERCSLGVMIPPKELWRGIIETKKDYLSSGEEHVDKMLEVARASGFSFAQGNRILDFGCGEGRMIRHLKNLSESCEIWGADISAEHIYWCKQYLDPPFHFVTTTTIPHLPFDDQYFDFVYAGSVFTHIDDLAEAWLLELRRILSPKGRLYITIFDNHTIKMHDTVYKDWWGSEWLRSHDLYEESKEILGMLVFDRDTAPIVFYDIDYFCKRLGSMYDILSLTNEAYWVQTAILLKRKLD